MKSVYDPEVDVFSFAPRNAAVAESDQKKPVVRLDYDGEGSVVGLGVLNASKRMAIRCRWSTPSRRHFDGRHDGAGCGGRILPVRGCELSSQDGREGWLSSGGDQVPTRCSQGFRRGL
jgi:uncharacterized protein YuzE